MAIRRKRVRVKRPRRKTTTRRRILRPRAVPTTQLQSRWIKLNYVDTITPSIVVGASDQWHWQTSCHDPYALTGGHQPLGWDQWKNFYTAYRVFGMSYKIQVASNTNMTSVVAVRKSPQEVAITDLTSFTERKTSKYGFASLFVHYRTKGYMSIAKTYGIPFTQVKNDDEFQALVGANPSSMAYLYLSIWNNQNTGATLYNIQVKTTYYVLLINPVVLAQS